jgi:hypothetical protein
MRSAGRAAIVAPFLLVAAAHLSAQEAAPSGRALLERYLHWRMPRLEPTGAPGALVADGSIRAGGRDGTVRFAWTADGRCRENRVVDGELTSFGIDEHGAWRQNRSGQVEDIAAVESGGTLSALRLKWLASLPDDALAGVVARGRETIAGAAGNLLAVPMQGRAPVELLLGDDGEPLAQRARNYGIEVTTRFSDWRLVYGLAMPFREEASGGREDRVVTWRTIASPASLEAAAVARPANRECGAFADGHDRATAALQGSPSGHWFAKASIDGKEMDAVIDTGAGATIVDDHTAEQLGMKAVGEYRGFGAGANGTGTAMHDGGEVTIAIGDARLAVRTQTSDLQALGRAFGHHVDVIVGHELLLAFVVQFDLRAKTLTLCSPATFTPPAGAVALPAYASGGGQIVVPGTVESLPPSWFMVDTGAPPALLLMAPYVNEHDLLKDRDVRPVALGGIDGRVSAVSGVLKTFALAGHVFGDVRTVFARADRGALALVEYAGIIGVGLLRKYEITFDLPHQRLLLVPLPAADRR